MKSILPAALTVLAVSCLKVANPKGAVQMTVLNGGPDLEFAQMPPAGDFDITLSDLSQTLWTGKSSAWGACPYAQDMPVSDNLKFEASFGDAEEEGFGKAYWYGAQPFSFVWEDVTVGVPVQLMNCCVKIECTELFKSYFPEYEFMIVTPLGNEVAYARGETGLVFQTPGKVRVKGSMSTYDGESREMALTDFGEVAPASCHTVTMDVSEIGGLHVEVVFDSEMDLVDLGEIAIDPSTTRVGTLSFGGLSVGCEQEFPTKAPVPVGGDYRVTILDSRREPLMKMSYSEARAVEGGIALPVGNYFLSVCSSDREILPVGLDCPVYGVEVPFKIAAGKMTELKEDLVCRLLQFVVSVEFQDEFLAAVTADSKVYLSLSSGRNFSIPVIFDGNAGTVEEHLVYFLLTEENTDLTVVFDGYISGRHFVAEKTYGNVTAASLRKVKFTLAE